MKTSLRLTLIRMGAAKRLTQAMLPFGEPESQDPSDCYGV